jgi:hypothetical protein
MVGIRPKSARLTAPALRLVRGIQGEAPDARFSRPYGGWWRNLSIGVRGTGRDASPSDPANSEKIAAMHPSLPR